MQYNQCTNGNDAENDIRQHVAQQLLLSRAVIIFHHSQRFTDVVMEKFISPDALKKLTQKFERGIDTVVGLPHEKDGSSTSHTSSSGTNSPVSVSPP
jgi:hypothetical protein